MVQSELEKDINIALKILYQEALTDEEKLVYAQLYPWSNEKIDKYYKYDDLTNKKTLCITSSGDHLLYAAAAGATEIDAFDKNRLCKYYAALKVALILSQDEANFYKCFAYKTNCILSKKLNLNDLKNFLPENYYIFWKEITSSKAFKKNMILFRFDGGPEKFNLDYDYLKRVLSKVKINYYDMNAQELLKNTTKTYDAIFLSNILEWMPDYYPLSRIALLSKFYNDLLNDNGIIYDYCLKRKNNNYSYICNPETQIITSLGFPGIEELTNQKVLIYRKMEHN